MRKRFRGLRTTLSRGPCLRFPASGASNALVACSASAGQRKPVRLQALNVTAVDISHARKRVQQEASGGPPAQRTEQGVRTIATVRQAAT